MEFLVDDAHDGVLLRSYLKGTCGVSSRLLIQLKKREDGITVNGEHATVRRKLRAGDHVAIAEKDVVSQEAFSPSALPFSILYEDDSLLIVDKPPDMPTHPSAGHDGDTLANALTWQFAERGEPFVFRPISRLDRNTSGILTLAKDQYAAALLCKEMQAHRIRKTYLAFTEGLPPAEAGRIETGTRRREDFFVLREVCPVDAPGAALTVTDYRVLETFGNRALLEVHPLTGRTHQIRVHLAHLGCPIMGDDLYGTTSTLIDRQALHAARLELTHPLTGEPMCFHSPLPPDMAVLHEELKKTT